MLKTLFLVFHELIYTENIHTEAHISQKPWTSRYMYVYNWEKKWEKTFHNTETRNWNHIHKKMLHGPKGGKLREKQRWNSRDSAPLKNLATKNSPRSELQTEMIKLLKYTD